MHITAIKNFTLNPTVNFLTIPMPTKGHKRTPEPSYNVFPYHGKQNPAIGTHFAIRLRRYKLALLWQDAPSGGRPGDEMQNAMQIVPRDRNLSPSNVEHPRRRPDLVIGQSSAPRITSTESVMWPQTNLLNKGEKLKSPNGSAIQADEISIANLLPVIGAHSKVPTMATAVILSNVSLTSSEPPLSVELLTFRTTEHGSAVRTTVLTRPVWSLAPFVSRLGIQLPASESQSATTLTYDHNRSVIAVVAMQHTNVNSMVLADISSETKVTDVMEHQPFVNGPAPTSNTAFSTRPPVPPRMFVPMDRQPQDNSGVAPIAHPHAAGTRYLPTTTHVADPAADTGPTNPFWTRSAWTSEAKVSAENEPGFHRYFAKPATNFEVDIDEVVEQVWRTLMSRLVVEKERRGFSRWS